MNIIFKFLLVSFLFTSLYSSVDTNSLSVDSLERIKSWQSMKEKAKDEKLLTKLKIVNDYFNKLSYSSDIKNWNRSDYWATPYEFLSLGAGDCEDYAIAKYFTLKELGIEDDKLKLTYAKLSKSNQAHIVLSYYHKPNYTPIILDNVNKKLQVSTKRKDLLNMRNISKDVIFSKFEMQTLNN